MPSYWIPQAQHTYGNVRPATSTTYGVYPPVFDGKMNPTDPFAGGVPVFN